MKRGHYPWRLALLVLLLVGVGCSIPPNRITFPERMADANKKLNGIALKLYGELLTLLSPGPNLDPALIEKVKALTKEAEQEVAQLKKDYNPGLLPTRTSPNAPALLEAYQKFLVAEDTIVNKHLNQVVTILEDPKLQRGVKWQQIRAELDAARALETPALKDVKEAQKKYAEDHFYSLVAERPKE